MPNCLLNESSWALFYRRKSVVTSASMFTKRNSEIACKLHTFRSAVLHLRNALAPSKCSCTFEMLLHLRPFSLTCLARLVLAVLFRNGATRTHQTPAHTF